jgi:hypothetical protein
LFVLKSSGRPVFQNLQNCCSFYESTLLSQPPFNSKKIKPQIMKQKGLLRGKESAGSHYSGAALLLLTSF